MTEGKPVEQGSFREVEAGRRAVARMPQEAGWGEAIAVAVECQTRLGQAFGSLYRALTADGKPNVRQFDHRKRTLIHFAATEYRHAIETLGAFGKNRLRTELDVMQRRLERGLEMESNERVNAHFRAKVLELEVMQAAYDGEVVSRVIDRVHLIEGTICSHGSR